MEHILSRETIRMSFFIIIKGQSFTFNPVDKIPHNLCRKRSSIISSPTGYGVQNADDAVLGVIGCRTSPGSYKEAMEQLYLSQAFLKLEPCSPFIRFTIARIAPICTSINIMQPDSKSSSSFKTVRRIESAATWRGRDNVV